MQPVPQSVPELIDRFGGPAAFSKVIDKGASTASEMKRSRSIPVGYWPKIISAAQERGFEFVTPELLLAIHVAKTESPAPEPDDQPQKVAAG